MRPTMPKIVEQKMEHTPPATARPYDFLRMAATPPIIDPIARSTKAERKIHMIARMAGSNLVGPKADNDRDNLTTR